ncbi:MAG: hypothetical protein IJ345_00195 [Clostridia bacterium]|nr:hypothetical protein [Clostridia bacterium]
MGKTNKSPNQYGQKSRKDKAVATACLVFAILIVAVFAVTAMNEGGLFIRMTKNVSGETITVDGAMMSFFMNDSIVNFYNQYYIYMYYGMISLDLTKDLHAQTLSANDASYVGSTKGITWYDYFLGNVKSEVTYYVTLAEAAKRVKDKDLSLTKEDYAEIDATIKDISASLKENGASYSDWYGKGVTKKDIRKCYELIYLATNFAEYMQEKYELELEENDDKVYKFPEDHKEDFYTADVLSYTISVAENKYPTQAKYDAAIKDAKDAAAIMAAASSIEEFFELIDKYEIALKEAAGEDETTEETTKEGETTAEETSEPTLEEKIEENKTTIEYETGSELGDWLFGNEENSAAEEGDADYFVETETAKETSTTAKEELTTEATETTAGETTVDGETSADEETSGEEETTASSSSASKGTYEITKVTVYYVLSPSGLDKELTHDFAYIVCNKKETLQSFLDSFKAGEKNNDKFVEVAQELKDSIYTEDYKPADTDIFEFNGGEKQVANAFNTKYKVLNEWIEDDARKDGDLSDIIEIKVDDKTTHYGVLFFQSHNVETWYSAAYSGVISEQFDAWYEDECKENPLVFNEDALNDITTIRFFQ